MESFYACTCEEDSQPAEEEEPLENITHDLLKCYSRTWHADEPRRHWEMILHCERAMYPRALPNLPLPSKEGRFYWHLYAATAKHQPFYQKDLNNAFLATLRKTVRKKTLAKKMILSEELIKIDSYDYQSRKTLIDQLEKYISQQTALEFFCMEGLQLKRAEGIRLLLALFNSRKKIVSLHCWRAFKRTQGPLLVDTGHFKGTGLYADRVPRKCDWFRAIGCLEALTTLSVNYAYIATPNGDLLIALAKQLGSNWQWLQLLCLEEESPIIADPNDGVGGHAIPDIAWREVRLWAPALKVQYVFVGIPEYDMHKKFFTKHTPIHTFALSSDIDLRFRQPWFIDCTIKTLWMWFSNTLVHLYLQLWHHREILDNQLIRLFPSLPKLKVFEFVGEIRNLKTLCAMCLQIRTGTCKVNIVDLILQKVIGIDTDRRNWTRSVDCLLTCFKQDFIEMGVSFRISYYNC